MMKVLVVGGGGREHALAWKIAQSQAVEQVFVAPGNAGTALEKDIQNLDMGDDQIQALMGFAQEQHIDLTIVGPEGPLVAGITDAFQQQGLRCFGPTRDASRLEGSKVFCKDFLSRHHIPTARYQTFTEIQPAREYIQEQTLPMVIKADGLAAGKGVIIARTQEEARAAASGMLSGKAFGQAGKRVIVEECLVGEEASFIVMVDGEHILPLATSQDHKARDDGDSGPNTGGMGAYSPAPVITPEMSDRIMKTVIQPTVSGLAAEGCPYSGFLYAGLMITPDGIPHVLEYNCRFGDPETQPILLRLRSDLAALCQSAMDGHLDRMDISWDHRAALGVVMAAGGYPEEYGKGHTITGLPASDIQDVKVFHAGTQLVEGRVVTSGGRVLCVTALGNTVKEAQAKAYGVAKGIHWEDVYYRTDIGHRAVARER